MTETPPIKLKPQELKNSPTIQQAFLAQSLHLAREVGLELSIAKKEDSPEKKPLEQRISTFVKDFAEEQSLESLLPIYQELTPKFLEEFTETRLTPEEKANLPDYLRIVKKASQLLKTRINNKAKQAYLATREGKYQISAEPLSEEQTGVVQIRSQDLRTMRKVRTKAGVEERVMELAGAARQSRLAKLVREAEFPGYQSYAEITLRELAAEALTLDAQSKQHLAAKVPEHSGRFEEIKHGFRRLLKRSPGLRLARAKVVGAVAVGLAAIGIREVNERGYIDLALKLINPPAVVSVSTPEAVAQLTHEDLKDLGLGGVEASEAAPITTTVDLASAPIIPADLKLPEARLPQQITENMPTGETPAIEATVPTATTPEQSLPAKIVQVPPSPESDRPASETPAKIDLLEKAQAESGGYKNFLYPVSQTRRLPENFPKNTAEVALVRIGNIEIAEVAAQPLRELLRGAEAAGHLPQLVSGFRSIETQRVVFEGNVQSEMRAGRSQEQAREAANRYSSKDGFSEHHTSFAVDIVDGRNASPDRVWDYARENYNRGFYQWLRDHAHEYGYIISYPTGSNHYQAKPGSGYPSAEPWHLRYVGKELARYLFEHGYLDRGNELTLQGLLTELEKTEKNLGAVEAKSTIAAEDVEQTPFMVRIFETIEKHRLARAEKDSDYLKRIDPELNKNRVNFCVLGVDRRPGDKVWRADTIMVASFDLKNKRLQLMHVPRDTYAPEVSALAETANPAWKNLAWRINAMTVFGDSESWRRILESATGLSQDACMVWDFEGFKSFITSLGGVDIEVTADFLQKYGPEFERIGKPLGKGAGVKHLDAEAALYYARVRYQDSDYERGKRGMQVSAAVGKAMLARLKAEPTSALGTMDKLVQLEKSGGFRLVGELNLGDIATLARELASSSDARQELTGIGQTYYDLGWGGGMLVKAGLFPKDFYLVSIIGDRRGAKDDKLYYWQPLRRTVKGIFSR